MTLEGGEGRDVGGVGYRGVGVGEAKRLGEGRVRMFCTPELAYRSL